MQQHQYLFSNSMTAAVLITCCWKFFVCLFLSLFRLTPPPFLIFFLISFCVFLFFVAMTNLLFRPTSLVWEVRKSLSSPAKNRTPSWPGDARLPTNRRFELDVLSFSLSQLSLMCNLVYFMFDLKLDIFFGFLKISFAVFCIRNVWMFVLVVQLLRHF